MSSAHGSVSRAACTTLILALAMTLWRVIARRKPEQRLGTALALAFYFTVPFAVLDTLDGGVWLGLGHQSLTQYWYLTVFSVMAWWKPRVTSS
jgi:hypothetical protein